MNTLVTFHTIKGYKGAEKHHEGTKSSLKGFLKCSKGALIVNWMRRL